MQSSNEIQFNTSNIRMRGTQHRMRTAHIISQPPTGDYTQSLDNFPGWGGWSGGSVRGEERRWRKMMQGGNPGREAIPEYGVPGDILSRHCQLKRDGLDELNAVTTHARNRIKNNLSLSIDYCSYFFWIKV